MLKEYSFHTQIGKLQLRLNVKPNDKGEILEVIGPNKEQVAAFLLTFRMFVQKKDIVSLTSLNGSILKDAEVSGEWKKRFKLLYRKYNQYLNDYPDIPVFPQGKFSPTRRDIMRILIYGNKAHLKKDDHESKKYEEWVQLPFNPSYIEFQFLQIIKYVFGIVEEIAELTKKELSR